MEEKPYRILLSIAILILISCAIIYIMRAGTSTASKDTIESGSVAAPWVSEAEKELDNTIADIANFLGYVEQAQRINFTISSNENDDDEQEPENSNNAPFVILTAEEINNQLDENKRLPFHFYQYIYGDRSQVSLETKALEKILDQAVFPRRYHGVKYEVTKIIFRDGSQLDNPVIMSDSDDEARFFYKSFILQENKPIDKIDVEIYYPISPNHQKIVLTKEQPDFQYTSGETFQLTAIQQKQASLLLSIAKSRDYYIEALSSSGQAIAEIGKNSQILPTEEEIKRLREYYQALQETKRNFKRFQNEEGYRDYLEQIAAAARVADSDLKVIQTTINFNATPQAIAVYLVDEDVIENSISRQFANYVEPRELYVAEDKAGEKTGLVNKSGKWVIQPEFANIRYTDVENIYHIETGREPVSESMDRIIYEYYRIASGTPALEKLPFQTVSKKINNELLLVQRETNGPYGVYDINNNQFVIPMEFVNPEIVDNLFIASLGDKTYGYQRRYGVYSLQGKVILAPKYDNIWQEEGVLYAENEYREAFTMSGKKITPDGYSAIGTFYQDQPLLIQHVKNGHYQFIDKTGNMFNFSLPYDKVQPFSNGMAVVIKEDKQGAIDLTGKLAVPLIYDKIYPFQKNLAAAERYDTSRRERLILIDKNNNVVKTLGSSSSLSVGYNSNNACYYINDMPREGRTTIFDADGNVVETCE